MRARAGAGLRTWSAEAGRLALMHRAASSLRESQPARRRAWRTWTEAAEAQRAREQGRARRAAACSCFFPTTAGRLLMEGCFWRWAQRAEASRLAVAQAEAEAERLWPLWRWLLATLGSDNKSAKQLAGLLVDPAKVTLTLT